MKRPKVLVLRGAGTNCDIETCNAFTAAGGEPELVHAGELVEGVKKFADYAILALPGGFSYGDDISAGKILAVKLRTLKADLGKFIASRRPVIGICNGFQVLVKTGFLPHDRSGRQLATLAANDCGRNRATLSAVGAGSSATGHFIAKWERLKVNKLSPCLFTKGLPDEIELPIAHGEGKFITVPAEMAKIKRGNLCALSYVANPNGSMADLAGLTNPEGTVLGLMPHPERFFFPWQAQNRRPVAELGTTSLRLHRCRALCRPARAPTAAKAALIRPGADFLPPGYLFFKNAVDYAG
ncbi:MAG: phosphoribosylformylglycinamidine synthase [Elusimicrobia bacterium]|nr:MAG: phosphoribosylformylglycinamidine synthase [Elusimicrobiota bacterium]KAF0158018.1 MAG: phosphoribosylformylglycinamidine synthase [Elusimicrobiota bacterium]